MAIEERSKEEILEDNNKLLGKIREAEMELFEAYPGREEELKKIFGTVLDTTKNWDFDEKYLEDYPQVYELLGVKTKEEAKKDERASVLIVNLRCKRCLNDIEVLKRGSSGSCLCDMSSCS